MRKNRRLAWEVVGKPTMRMALVTLLGGAWYLASAMLFLYWLPQFNYYEQIVINQKTNDTSVYLFWLWVPEILFFLFGIMWASGLFGEIGEWMERI